MLLSKIILPVVFVITIPGAIFLACGTDSNSGKYLIASKIKYPQGSVIFDNVDDYGVFADTASNVTTNGKCKTRVKPLLVGITCMNENKTYQLVYEKQVLNSNISIETLEREAMQWTQKF